MAKTYADELAEWVKRQKTTGRDRNLVAFHAVQSDVELAMSAGYSAKTVWSNLRETGRIGFGYETFLSYVQRASKKDRVGVNGSLRTQSGASVMASAAQALPSSTAIGAISASKAMPSSTPTPPAALEEAAAAPVSHVPIVAQAPAPKRVGMPTFSFQPIPKHKEDT